MNRQIIHLFFLMLGSLLLGGCGGGADLSRPEKSATITFSLARNATLPTTIQGISIQAKLPLGATVIADPSGTGGIDTTGLRGPVGSGLSPLGTYTTGSDGTQTVTILVTKNAGIPVGDFAVLTCRLSATSTLTQASFTSVNSPSFPYFEAERLLDSGTYIDLSSLVTPSLRVTLSN